MSVNKNVTVPVGRAPSCDVPGATAGSSSVTFRPLPMPAGHGSGRREIAASVVSGSGISEESLRRGGTMRAVGGVRGAHRRRPGRRGGLLVGLVLLVVLA